MVEKNILELTGPAFFQNATNTDLFYTFIKTQKLVSFYVNGKKYFLFAFKGKIFTLSEFQLTFVICFITASSVIALRKLAKRYQLKKKIAPLSQ